MSSSGSGHCSVVKVFEGEDEAYADILPPGFKFVPTDEELVAQFLTPKLLGHDHWWLRLIHEINLELYHPAKLTEKYESSEGCWYFYTSNKRKYGRGRRPRRSAAGGFWRAICVDTVIRNSEGEEIGKKKSLKFIEGKQNDKASQKKTPWLMHEFTIQKYENPVEQNKETSENLFDYVLCKIYRSDRSTDETDESKGVPAVAAPSKTFVDPQATANKRQRSSAEELAQQQPPQSQRPAPSYSPIPAPCLRSRPPNWVPAASQQQPATCIHGRQLARFISPHTCNGCMSPQLPDQQLMQSIEELAQQLPPPTVPNTGKADLCCCYYRNIVEGPDANFPCQDFHPQQHSPMQNFNYYGNAQMQPSSSMQPGQFHPRYGTTLSQNHFQFQQLRYVDGKVVHNPMLANAAILRGKARREMASQHALNGSAHPNSVNANAANLPGDVLREMAAQHALSGSILPNVGHATAADLQGEGIGEMAAQPALNGSVYPNNVHASAANLLREALRETTSQHDLSGSVLPNVGHATAADLPGEGIGEMAAQPALNGTVYPNNVHASAANLLREALRETTSQHDLNGSVLPNAGHANPAILQEQAHTSES